MRTPLAAMRLTAELIAKEPLSDTQRTRLEILVRAIDNLTGMTSSLVYAGASGGPPQAEPAGVHNLLEDTANLFRLAANANGLVLTTNFDPTLEGSVTLYPGHLTRTVATLLDNAIKYTGNGMVHLSACCRIRDPASSGGIVLEVTVTDTGPGLKEADIDSVFKPYVRGTAARHAAGGGAGLGLWGASELLKEVGGTMEVSSPEQGGCQFVISFPVTAGEAAHAAAFAEMPAKPTFDGPLNGHFLVVDDNGTNRRLLAALLESFGASLQEAGNGREALDAAANNSFDAILLDLHMPGMSGIDVARHLNETANGSRPAVIAVTAAHESADPETLRETGIDTVIAKPISPAALYGTLSEALCRARQARS
ncbi:hypothetical protein GCM10011316_08700 [Roseibium aquae]|uniref:histidine kinase n=2 Tax=Roseibium aquae TaxID=1323746 RepID=A0A916WW85_9HYPH|nr:hypothetical protein GCM10011316_08700 [Roseibium aquae]